MSRGVGALRCDECRRTFSGHRVFDGHRLQDRCMTTTELRRRFVQREDGTWTRPGRAALSMVGRQCRLWPQGRPPHPRELAPGVYRHIRPRRSAGANRVTFTGQLVLFLLVLAGRR